MTRRASSSEISSTRLAIVQPPRFLAVGTELTPSPTGLPALPP